jgi:glycosyltransferase involved in cell wall biosynthesis
MRLLFLSAWCPLPANNGAKLRVSALLRELARQHEIDLISFAPEPPGEPALTQLRQLCAQVELVPESPFAERRRVSGLALLTGPPRSMHARYSDCMAQAVRARSNQQYDLVIASTLHTAPYALLLDRPRLLEEIELTVLRDQYRQQPRIRGRLRYWLTWWKTRRYIAWLLHSFAAATTVSERELTLVRPLAPRSTRLAVVPNGVDVERCSGDFGAPEADTLVYPGALSFQANFDAVAYFLQAIMPHIRAARSTTQLHVTGHATPEQIAALPCSDGVHFTGFVDDIRPVVARAWAEVVPLRTGGGTRLKVLEALALGTPLISTPKGVEGLAVEHGRQALIADTPQAFAEATLHLLGQPALRAQLAASGRELVRQRYDWHAIGSTLDAIIRAV